MAKQTRWPDDAVFALEDAQTLLASLCRRYESHEGNWFMVVENEDAMFSPGIDCVFPSMTETLATKCVEELNSVMRKYAERSLDTLEEDMNVLKEHLNAVTTFIQEKRKD